MRRRLQSSQRQSQTGHRPAAHARCLYLLQQDASFIKQTIKDICEAYPRYNQVAMGKSIERQKSWGPRKTCQVVLNNHYQDFAKAWAKVQKVSGKQGLEVVPLRELQAWLAILHVYIKDFHFYPELFGEENLYIQVRLSGQRENQNTITSVVLRSGHYAGEGIVADFAESPAEVLPLHALSREEDDAELFSEELANDELMSDAMIFDEVWPEDEKSPAV